MAITRDQIIEKWAFSVGLHIYPERIDKRNYVLIIKDGNKPEVRGKMLFDVRKTDWADKIRELREIYYKKRVENGQK